MKRTYTLIASVFLIVLTLPSFSQKIVETQYYENNPSLGGDVVISSSTKEVIGNKSYTRFEINAPRSGSYYLNAWLMATKLNDGTYSSYDVLVNGAKIAGRLAPTRGDWQSIGLTTGKVVLHAGVNTVSIVGTVPEIPEVEFIKLSASNTGISSAKYDNYIKGLKEQSVSNPMSETGISTMSFNPGDWTQFPPIQLDTLREFQLAQRSAPFIYEYQIGVRVQYTYYNTFYFTAGQEIFIATTGVNNFGHILEFFSSSEPENYSWVAKSNNNCMATLTLTIPKTGTYYVRARSNKNARAGMCNLSINGQYQYDNIPLWSAGIRCVQKNDNVYNSFTCYSTTDPRIWIEEGSSIPGKISAFNDDYSGSGDFYWGRNSRIKKQYTRTVHAVQVSAFSSSDPVGTCDLYAGCPNSTIAPYFENLKSDDAIQSAPEDRSYNCIAWSGGIWDSWEWPLNQFSEHYVPGGSDLDCFDHFYNNPRYEGASTFTRSGATVNNNIIDLWAIKRDGYLEFTHASVRKGAENFPHGYDWESKPGSLMRTFHPRYALNGRSYGDVSYYYRVKDIGKGLTYPFYAALAEGTSVLPHVTFTASEKEIIAAEKAKMTASQISNFNIRYAAWKNKYADSPLSNPAKYRENIEYSTLVSYCRSLPSTQYLVFEKLGEEDFLAILLIEDLTLANNTNNTLLLRRIKALNAQNPVTDSGATIVRTPYSNAMTYVKDLLGYVGTQNRAPAKSIENDGEATGITYSNTNPFHVTNMGNDLYVKFEIGKEAVVSVDVFDYSGNKVALLLSRQVLTCGNYQYFTTLPAGAYLVKFVVNGNINIRKVIIK